MRLTNATPLSTAWLAALVKALRPPGIEHTHVRVELGPRNDGDAWHGGHGAHARVRITPLAIKAPQCIWKAGSVRGLMLNGLAELVTYLLAHELRHLGQRGPLEPEWMERDANAYAVRAVRRYRRHGLPRLP